MIRVSSLSCITSVTSFRFVTLYIVVSFYALASFASSPEDSIEVTQLIPAPKVQIAGTLTLPREPKTDSLVIMLSGSGPQDRDETLDGFKVFKALSDNLSSAGIATFRFDDRGVGQSTGDFASSTLQDHANDVIAIINHFKTHANYPFKTFVLLGHSQGGIVSARVAVQNNDVEKVVLMAAPAVPLIEIVTYQIRQEYQGTRLSSELIEAEVSAHNRLMHAIREKRDIESALRVFEAATKASLAASNVSYSDANEIATLAKAKTQEFEIVYALPSLTSFLYHDTAQDYAQLSIPVLSLFGGKDLQVTIAQNKDPMENALLQAKTSYVFETFSAANHYFQKADTGKRDEYRSLDKQFVSGFPEAISNWILESR